MMMTVIMITGKSDSEIVTKQAAINPRMMLRKGSRHFNTTAIAIIMSMVVTTAKPCQ